MVHWYIYLQGYVYVVCITKGLLFSVILSGWCFLTGSNDDDMCTEDGHLGLLMIGGNDGAANKSVDLITCEI